LDLTFLPDWPPTLPAALAVAILALVAAAAALPAAWALRRGRPDLEDGHLG